MGACWKVLASVPALFGLAESVQIEFLRLLTAVVGAVAAIVGAALAYRANVRISRHDETSRRKRREVRDPESEQVLVLDTPPQPDQRKP